MASDNKGFADLLQSQKGVALKRFMIQILEGKYQPYDDLLDRITFFLITDRDIQSFSKMIGDVYEQGYMKAVADYKEQLDKLGVNVRVTRKNLADSQ